MWRDRTNLYISYRQSYTHHPAKSKYTGASNGFAEHGSEETRGLMSEGAFDNEGDAVIEMDLLPPRWVDVQDEVGDTLKDITVKSAQLDKLHAKHVLPGFDDDDVKQREEVEIERLTQEITRGFQNCQKAIKRIERMVKEAKVAGNLARGDEVMAQNIQVALASRVQDVSAAFRKKQSNYLNKLRALGGFESPFARSSTPVQNPYSDPALMESDADKSFSQSTLQQTAQKQFRGNDTAIAQREQEINDIAKGIIELADIFRELQGMVIDQGTMLDRIDYNVERMTVDVKGAEKELIVRKWLNPATTPTRSQDQIPQTTPIARSPLSGPNTTTRHSSSTRKRWDPTKDPQLKQRSRKKRSQRSRRGSARLSTEKRRKKEEKEGGEDDDDDDDDDNDNEAGASGEAGCDGDEAGDEAGDSSEAGPSRPAEPARKKQKVNRAVKRKNEETRTRKVGSLREFARWTRGPMLVELVDFLKLAGFPEDEVNLIANDYLGPLIEAKAEETDLDLLQKGGKGKGKEEDKGGKKE